MGERLSETKPQPTGNEATLRLSIDGMHCSSCVGHVEKALQSVDSVVDASVSLADSSAGGYLGQGPQLAPHSGGIAQALDDELMEILAASYEHDLKFLREHQDQLEKMAQRLLETETLDASDVTDILGPAPSEGLP